MIWFTSTRPPTEDGQTYMLAFRNLGLVTPCPRLALVFYLFRNLTNYDCVPPAYPLGIWKGSCGLITLSAIFISFLVIQRLVFSILFSKSVELLSGTSLPNSMCPNSSKIFNYSSFNIHPFKLIIYKR